MEMSKEEILVLRHSRKSEDRKKVVIYMAALAV